MSRFALVALLSASLGRSAVSAATNAPPTASAPVSETAARAQATAYVEALCKKAPAECDDAAALLLGYEDILKTTALCTPETCPPARLQDLARSLWDLDVKEHALKYPDSSSTGRPLLRLSVMVSERLAEIAVRGGNPNVTIDSHFSPDIQAPKAVEEICLLDPGGCETYRKLLSDAQDLASKVADCERSPCSFDVLDGFMVRSNGELDVYLGHVYSFGKMGLPIFSVLSEEDKKITGLYAAKVMSAVGDLQKSADSQDSLLSSNPPKLPPSSEDATLDAAYKRASLGVDRLSKSLGYEQVSTQQDKINVLAARMSGLRARENALKAALGLLDPKADPGSGAAAGGRASARGPINAKSRSTLLDKASVPSPAPLPAPPILTFNLPKSILPDAAVSTNSLLKAGALRLLHRTKTVGDPGRLATFAYHQGSETTCAIATQLQVLRARGLLPPGDPRLQEKALVDEANDDGTFRDGVLKDYSGSLLVAHGLIISKHVQAGWPDLEAAIRRGSTVIASVDARLLWNDVAPKAEGHSILVTGAEVTLGGDLLGVYINDSGTDPAGAGRFVPIETFRPSWETFTRDFVEVLP